MKSIFPKNITNFSILYLKNFERVFIMGFVVSVAVLIIDNLEPFECLDIFFDDNCFIDFELLNSIFRKINILLCILFLLFYFCLWVMISFNNSIYILKYRYNLKSYEIQKNIVLLLIIIIINLSFKSLIRLEKFVELKLFECLSLKKLTFMYSPFTEFIFYLLSFFILIYLLNLKPKESSNIKIIIDNLESLDEEN